MKILCCTCFSVAESFLFQGLWPATPVEPTLAFTTSLMEFTLALVMECQVSIFDLVKASDFYSHPLIKVRYRFSCKRLHHVIVIRVGQGFWVYGIKGLF